MIKWFEYNKEKLHDIIAVKNNTVILYQKNVPEIYLIANIKYYDDYQLIDNIKSNYEIAYKIICESGTPFNREYYTDILTEKSQYYYIYGLLDNNMLKISQQLSYNTINDTLPLKYKLLYNIKNKI